MLGDGLFHVVYMAIVMLFTIIKTGSKKVESFPQDENRSQLTFDEQKRNEYFTKDQISTFTALGGYITLAIISIFIIPNFIFPQLKWYHMLVAYIIAPILAFCNAYGCGLTDWSLASNYGKLAILIFSGWAGMGHGGIIAGLAACVKLLERLWGVLCHRWCFGFFYRAYSVGDPDGSYPAPYGALYLGIAVLGVEGLGALPHNCLKLSIWFFVGAILVNLLTVVLKRYEKRFGVYRFIPSPMCVAIPFYLGAYFAIDMCIGSLILFVWEKKNKKAAKELAPAVASGMICGDSLWGIPAAVLAMAGVKAPICMKFLSASVNKRVDGFLGS
ncbi:unnamed protein product [Lactuca virosa]|uniref:Metal-nicotianamine transporter YSL7 n=1 Tax=Lactuca virosa TaxID=75947 RepID=A0AAU9PWK0_9ASTR|nr:unnamed protein product [Lactuca virosa]